MTYQILDGTTTTPDSVIPLEDDLGSKDQKIPSVVDGIISDIRRQTYFQSDLSNRIQALNQPDLYKILIQKVCTLDDNCIDYFLQVVQLGILQQPLKQKDVEEFLKVVKYMQACKQLYRPSKAIPPAYNTSTPSVIDSVVTAFGYQVSSDGPGSLWEATQQIQVYLMLLAFPFIVSFTIEQLLQGYLPRIIDRLVIFGTVAGLLILTIGGAKIHQKIYPIPDHIKPLRNLTKDVVDNDIDPLWGRDEIIDKVFLCWQSTHNSVRQHPLLVGTAGSGKTVIMMEIARRIAKGEFNQSFKPTLEGKYIFGGSAALLLSNSNGMESDDKIDRLLTRIYPIRNRIMLSLDEIHVLMDNENGPRYGELLKSILDTSLQGLPYVIGATTPADYKKFIASDPSKVRRFKVIPLPTLSKEEVKFVLREMMRRYYSEIYLSEAVLDYIYCESEKLCLQYTGLSQPEISKRILTTIISKVAMESLRPSAELNKHSKQGELDNLTSRYITLFDSEDRSSIEKQIDDAQGELKELSKRVNLQREGIEKYQHLSKRLAKCKEELLRIAVKIPALATDNPWSNISPTNLPFIKKFIFYHFYLMPDLKEQISNIQKTHQIEIPEINQKLVGMLIEELKVSLQDQAKEEEQQATGEKSSSLEIRSDENRVKLFAALIGPEKLAEACHKVMNGMVNNSNDCFMIAMFQLIFHNPSIAKYLLDQQKAKNDTIHACILDLAFDYISNKTHLSSSFQKMRKAFNFSALDQEDAVEIINKIFSEYKLDSLESSFERKITVDLKAKTPVVKEKINLEEYSVVNASSSCITPYTSSHIQIYLSKENNDFQTYVNEIVKPREVKDKMCFVQNSSLYSVDSYVEQIEIKKLESGLFFQMMRFKKNEKELWDKDETLIIIPESIRIDHIEYRLQSFIVHQGKDKARGHYIAYCKTDQSKWYLFDDAKSPQEVSSEKVLEAAQQSYLLYFCKST